MNELFIGGTRDELKHDKGLFPAVECSFSVRHWMFVFVARTAARKTEKLMRMSTAMTSSELRAGQASSP